MGRQGKYRGRMESTAIPLGPGSVSVDIEIPGWHGWLTEERGAYHAKRLEPDAHMIDGDLENLRKRIRSLEASEAMVAALSLVNAIDSGGRYGAP